MPGIKTVKQILADATTKRWILRYLRKAIRTRRKFEYKTFGTAIEPFALNGLKQILRRNNIPVGASNFKVANNKNSFPDLTMVDENIAIDIKSGNHKVKKGGSWRACTNSQNDLGTINSWPSKLKKYNYGHNIFFIFIEYEFDDSNRKIIRVKIDHFFRFVGINGKRLLNYREKDGNLRPKKFSSNSPINSLKQFNRLFVKTRAARAVSIITKKIENEVPKRIRGALCAKICP